MRQTFWLQLFLLAFSTASVVAEQPAKPVTESECRRIGEAFASKMLEKDTASVSELTDWREATERLSQGIKVSDEMRAGLPTGYPKYLNQELIRVLNRSARAGDYSVAQVKQRDRQWVATLLLHNYRGLTNIHELTMVRDKNGAVKVVDLFNFSTGDTMAQTFRGAFLQAAARNTPTVIDELKGWDHDFLKHLPDINALAGAVQDGQGSAALKMFSKLPETLQRDRHLMQLKIDAALSVGTPETRAALLAFRKEVGDGPTFTWSILNQHLLVGPGPDTKEYVSKLESRFGRRFTSICSA